MTKNWPELKELPRSLLVPGSSQEMEIFCVDRWLER